MTPQPQRWSKALPAPAPADYSDDITDEAFDALLEEVKEYQKVQGDIVSGEPW